MPTDTDRIRVIHAIPGHIRLKVVGLKGNQSLAAKIPRELATVPGIHDVEVNAVTENVLVCYSIEMLATSRAASALSQALARLFPDFDLTAYRRLLEH
jgi:hypothetical protein